MIQDDERYARSDGLIRWCEAEDERLDGAIRAKVARITRLDDIARAVATAPAASPFETTLLIAAATSAWDEARRLSGMPELCIGNQRKRTEQPFATFVDALRFYVAGRPGAIGAGSMSVPSVPDRDEDLRARRCYSNLGIETMPVNPTRASADADPKNLRRLELWISVERAIDRAELWKSHKAAKTWLIAAHIGIEERVPKSRREGGDKKKPHRRSPQFELVRQHVDDVTIDGTRVEGIASRAQEPPRVVRNALRLARMRLIESLMAAELIPKPEPRRSRPAPTRAPNDPTFADW